jgi:alcohol/geraniol dehydrogenase (NADP+)
MAVSAFAALKKGAPLTPISYQPAILGAQEIDIKITHCGLCHSDIHLIDNDWGLSKYPLVPGHEIVGTVTAVGKQADKNLLGAHVGVGWQRGACFSCSLCRRGDEHLCAESQATCVGHHGGYASSIRVDHRFAFLIPDSMPSETAAPLLCGGITVYAPLRRHARSFMNVGIIGIGGLGHLALQFADKMGCHVTAISSSANKEKEARAFGAEDFICTTDKGAAAHAAERFDFLLSTVNAPLDWATWIDTLRADGTLCFVGVPNEALSLPVFKLLDGRKSICGSPIGSPAMIQEMLTFAARHQIQAQVESTPLSRVNDAIEKVRRNKARYRMVLTIE